LHKIWKKILVLFLESTEMPWNQFSDLTKQMHDKRELLFEN
jgi:hypothetical protein